MARIEHGLDVFYLLIATQDLVHLKTPQLSLDNNITAKHPHSISMALFGYAWCLGANAG